MTHTLKTKHHFQTRVGLSLRLLRLSADRANLPGCSGKMEIPLLRPWTGTRSACGTSLWVTMEQVQTCLALQALLTNLSTDQSDECSYVNSRRTLKINTPVYFSAKIVQKTKLRRGTSWISFYPLGLSYDLNLWNRCILSASAE